MSAATAGAFPTDPAYRAAMDRNAVYAIDAITNAARQFDGLDDAEAIHRLAIFLQRGSASRPELAGMLAALAVHTQRNPMDATRRTRSANAPRCETYRKGLNMPPFAEPMCNGKSDLLSRLIRDAYAELDPAARAEEIEAAVAGPAVRWQLVRIVVVVACCLLVGGVVFAIGVMRSNGLEMFCGAMAILSAGSALLGGGGK